MGIALGSNFDVQTNLPLDSRAVVADITARDAISSLRRYEGMSVYVIATQKEYTLKGGITNAEWTEAMAQGVTVVNTATDRDAITLISRYEGMLVYVKDSKITYQMTSGALTNDGWTYYYGVTASDDVGEIITSARDLTDPHEGTLPCDGATLYDATLYPTLAAKFWNSTQGKWKFGGTGTYPTGQFRTPNFKGAFIRGADLGAGRDPDAASRTASGTNGVTGDAVGSYQDEAFKSHTHIQDAHNHTQNPHTHSMNQLADTVGTTGAIGTRVNVSFDQYTNATTATNNPTTATNQNTGGSETRPKNIAVNFFVRYKPSTRGPKGDTGNAINVVADDTARLAIPAGDRFDGYLAYVQSTKKNWQLQGGIANANWVELADVSSNQVIINKDIDGGTASNLSRITLPKAAKTTLDGLTRKQGTLLYDTTTNKPYYDDGTFLKVIGSGSGGSINFISGGDAESGTTGITPYNEGSSASRPSAGTGIAPTGITIGTDSTNPLSGTNSFILSKSAVNARGQGYSWSFTIDRAYQAKVLKIEMDYVVNSGSFVAGSPTTDSDLIVYIIDVDSGKAIEPSSFKLLSNSTSISDKFSATFQTSAASLNYRLCLHVANNTTNTWQIKFDNLAVSPSNYVYGTPITDWVSYTPTFTGFGTVSAFDIKSRRVGDSLEVKGYFLAGTTTATEARMTIGYGGNANVTSADSAGQALGILTTDAFGATYFNGAIISTGSNFIRFGQQTSTTGALNPVNGSAFQSAKYVSVNFSTKILGWSSSVQVSDGYDGRVVAVSAYGSGSITSGTTPNILNLGTTVVDKTNSLASNTFTVPSAGDYSFTAHFQGNSASGQQMLSIFVDGIEQTSFTSQISMLANGQRQTISGILPLKSGQLVTIRGWQNSGSAVNMNSSFNIQKLSGNPVISASETVGALYTGAPPTGTLSAAYNIVTFGTKVKDSHGAYSGGSYTVPATGQYDINATFGVNGSFVAAAEVIASIFIDGIETITLPTTLSSPGTFNLYGSVKTNALPLKAGQVVTIRSYINGGSSLSFVAIATRNSFSITRSGGY